MESERDPPWEDGLSLNWGDRGRGGHPCTSCESLLERTINYGETVASRRYSRKVNSKRNLYELEAHRGDKQNSIRANRKRRSPRLEHDDHL